MERGKMAMQIISDHPLYASTSGITNEEAIAIAKVFVPDGNFKAYLAEIERFENLSVEEMKAELNIGGR